MASPQHLSDAMALSGDMGRTQGMWEVFIKDAPAMSDAEFRDHMMKLSDQFEDMMAKCRRFARPLTAEK